MYNNTLDRYNLGYLTSTLSRAVENLSCPAKMGVLCRKGGQARGAYLLRQARSPRSLECVYGTSVGTRKEPHSTSFLPCSLRVCEYLDCVLAVHVARTAPNCGHGNKISVWINLDQQYSWDLAQGYSKDWAETYCIADSGSDKSTVASGAAVVRPTKASWRKVLYLLIWVGRTSAEGSEKSQ